MRFYRQYGKRIFDIFFSLFIILLLFPIFILLYILILFKLGKPCLFKQSRPGKNGKIFTLYKFRTMKDLYDESGSPLSDELRMTRFGNFLRKSSLDELPEFFNVLKGNMSLIGPRPLLIEYLALYNKNQSRRHEVKPGMTGWTQINGRNALSWENKFKLDVWYVDHVSFLLDMKIFFMTLYVVFARRGINAEGHVSMPKFTGRDSLGSNQ